MSIDSKKILGMFENTREVLGLLCRYGVLFFSTIEFDLVDFIPLAGCSFRDGENDSSTHIYISFADKTERLIIFPSVMLKRSWFEKFNKAVGALHPENIF